MRTTSNRELARRLGVCETAVRRAERAGRIARAADGAWELARVRPRVRATATGRSSAGRPRPGTTDTLTSAGLAFRKDGVSVRPGSSDRG